MNKVYPYCYLSVEELRARLDEIYLSLLESIKACHRFEDWEAALTEEQRNTWATEEKINELGGPIYEYQDLMRKQYGDLYYALVRALS